MQYKGELPLKTQSVIKNNGDGTASLSETYATVPGGAVPTVGTPQITRTKNGAVDMVDVSYANTNESGEPAPTDKWEDDTEILEKDIMFSTLAKRLSTEAKKEFLRWRKNPDSELEVGQSDPGFPDDPANLTLLQSEVLRGVESITVKTVVLKRTRTTPSGYLTQRKVDAEQPFFSTARLISSENVPTDVASQLPANPTDKPDDTEWGWMQRTSNRQFTGKGRCEETSDWVFAAWSTNLYIYHS